jgi:cytochrome oxidase Cu insertion factor (SCO1/SenC/PrrC family)
VVAGLLALLAVFAFAPQLHEGDAVPPLRLVDQDGRPFLFEQLHGRVVVLSFIYTRCTDRCALVAAKLNKLATESDPNKIAVAALTVDPDYDRPAVLSRYRAALDSSARLTLATGPAAPLLFLERRFGVDPKRESSTRVEHADLVVVLDPQGRIARFVAGDNWTPQQLAVVAREVSGAPFDPLTTVQLWLADAAAGCGRAVASLSTGTEITLVGLLTLAIAAPLVAGVVRYRPR